MPNQFGLYEYRIIQRTTVRFSEILSDICDPCGLTHKHLWTSKSSKRKSATVMLEAYLKAG